MPRLRRMSSMSFMSSSSGSAFLREPFADAAAVARSAGTRWRSVGRICVPAAVLAFPSAGGADDPSASPLRPPRPALRASRAARRRDRPPAAKKSAIARPVTPMPAHFIGENTKHVPNCPRAAPTFQSISVAPGGGGDGEQGRDGDDKAACRRGGRYAVAGILECHPLPWVGVKELGGEQ